MERLNKAYRLALITQDRGFEKVLKRVSRHFGCILLLYETCSDFINDLKGKKNGVVVVDASVCTRIRLMDLQMVLDEAAGWNVVFLPSANKKSDIKSAMNMGAFGCLHKPVNEQEVRQMVYSAMGI